MSEVPQVLLGHHLKALKLPTFLREYDRLARRCAAEGVAHTGYLLRLAELELIDRELGAAGPPADMFCFGSALQSFVFSRS
jgi:hypothetical protein